MPLTYPSYAAGNERPRLIYLPGLDGTGDLFYRQQAGLDRLFDVRAFRFNHLIAPSWPELVSTVIDNYMHERPVVLCGESFGACLALAVADRLPEAVAGLILVNPASSFRRASVLNSLSALLMAIPEVVVRASSGLSLNWLCIPSRLASTDLERFQQAIKSVRKVDTLHRLELLKQFDVSARPLEQFTCPVLVLAGQRDRLLPSESEARRLVTRLSAAELKLLPNSGHACLLERDMDLAHMLQSSSVFEPLLASPANLG
ncbi:MAG: alpha/beta hydrolase [Cyanobacteria bacterium P01_E01_bin.34]